MSNDPNILLSIRIVMSTSNNKEEYTQTNIIINARTTLSRKP